MYRAVATVLAPATDNVIDSVADPVLAVGVSSSVLDALKFGPGVAERFFVGSFYTI